MSGHADKWLNRFTFVEVVQPTDGMDLEQFTDYFVNVKKMPADQDWAAYKTYHDRCLYFRSSYYQVAVDKETEHGFGNDLQWAHLSIKRIDQKPFHDWRELQAIKNAIVGEETDAIELYPKESRVMDTANQYHLYALMKVGDMEQPFFPLGVFAGMKVDKAPGTAQQRRRDETLPESKAPQTAPDAPDAA